MSRKVQIDHADQVAAKQRSSGQTVRGIAAMREHTRPAAMTHGSRSASGSPASHVLQLQRAIGNRAVRRLLQFKADGLEPTVPAGVQAKLAVNTPGDSYEQEADRVSEQVMSMPGPQLQGDFSRGGGSPGCQTKQQTYGQEPLQGRRAQTGDPEQSAAPPVVHDVLRSPGKPLDPATRDFMEPLIGHDLSQVRVHADQKAADSARELNALAYTAGRDVVFGAGQYTPGSSEGRKLLAHELTHVVQQGFTTRAVQRKDDKGKKAATGNRATSDTGAIFNEIKKRDPDLAKLITPSSIDPKQPAEPPAISGGPRKGGEEHIWKVRVYPGFGRFSSTNPGGEIKTRVKGHTQVTHFIIIRWVLPLVAKDDREFTLRAAESLYHELLHARIMMERDPHWTGQHTQVFQGYADIMQLAESPAVDKERRKVKDLIEVMARMGGRLETDEDVIKSKASGKSKTKASGKSKTNDEIAEKSKAIAERYYEFLVHEKYDVNIESKAFGKSKTNDEIAKEYSKTVARRLNLSADAYQPQKDQLAAAAEKLYDKLDQLARMSTPGGPPATEQP
jgi:hypothetical protein